MIGRAQSGHGYRKGWSHSKGGCDEAFGNDEGLVGIVGAYI